MDDTDAVKERLQRYYRDFSSLDAEVIAPYFHEPCVFISQQGVNAAATLDDLKTFFKTIADGFRPRGYTRSELTQLQVKTLTNTTAFATGIAVRYKGETEVLERVGVTYVLQKGQQEWMIVVTIIHDADAMGS
jgi:ketosteroid isomerase-like protein